MWRAPLGTGPAAPPRAARPPAAWERGHLGRLRAGSPHSWPPVRCRKAGGLLSRSRFTAEERPQGLPGRSGLLCPHNLEMQHVDSRTCVSALPGSRVETPLPEREGGMFQHATLPGVGCVLIWGMSSLIRERIPKQLTFYVKTDHYGVVSQCEFLSCLRSVRPSLPSSGPCSLAPAWSATAWDQVETGTPPLIILLGTAGCSRVRR